MMTPLLTGKSNDLFRRVLHPARYCEVHARLTNHALPFFNVRSFQTYDDGNFHAKILSRSHHAARNHVAAYNSAEDVYEHAANVLVHTQNFECGLDALLRSAAANVQKVRRLATSQFDYVHRRHSQPRAVHHA